MVDVCFILTIFGIVMQCPTFKASKLTQSMFRVIVHDTMELSSLKIQIYHVREE